MLKSNENSNVKFEWQYDDWIFQRFSYKMDIVYRWNWWKKNNEKDVGKGEELGILLTGSVTTTWMPNVW